MATPALLFVGLVFLTLGLISPFLLVSAFLDLLSALFVLVPPVLVGLFLVGRLPTGRLPPRLRFLLASGLGIGSVSLLALCLGSIGILSRSVWLALYAGFLSVGVWECIRFTGALANAGNWRSYLDSPIRIAPNPQSQPRSTLRLFRLQYAYLALVPLVVLALWNASNAPGFLWSEEGYGYDILEYHLQLPKEYLLLGRIAYLPHNVYCAFPANVEMLYLLSMILHGSTVELGTVANHIHFLLGALFVFALWVIGREYSPLAGLIAALLGGTVGWLSYLSGLAYVELGMLFFGACAFACAQHAISSSRMIFFALAGVMAGFACGCKYPAVAFIALPLALPIVLQKSAQMQLRLRNAGLYLAGCMVAFSPWLLKNTIETGNPVFPLVNSVFKAAPPGWSSEEDDRWRRGHAPKDGEKALAARASLLWSRTFADPMQRLGPVVLLLGLTLLLGRKLDRWDVSLLVILLVQICVWVFATHLFARFAVPLVIPLIALAAKGTTALSTTRAKCMIGVVITAGIVWNFVHAARLTREEAPTGAPASMFVSGSVPGFSYLGLVNNELPTSAKVLLVGESRPFYVERASDYCVVFNKNPWADAIRLAKSPADIVQWLRERKITHVLVHWMEIRRLARTYGFPPEINPLLFEQLTGHGLRLIREFQHPSSPERYVDIYEVIP